MTRLSIVICTLASSVILFSCGTNKKLEQSQAHALDLEAKNSELSRKINEMEKDVSRLTAQNQAIAQDYEKYKTSCEATAAKLKKTQEEYDEMEAAMMSVAEDVAELQERLDSALADFESRGVEVYAKENTIYVSMEDKLLYKSGSAALGNEGKKALGILADVLNDYPKLKVIVVGNTDTAHVKGVADNWSLSTERANGVVRILSKDYKVDPARLTAAGKGKFSPIANNSTPEGRAKNRRTDIILNPDLVKLWETVREEDK